MGTKGDEHVQWQALEVTRPHLADPVSVVAALDIDFLPRANRFQNLSIYLPLTPETSKLIGTPATSLPVADVQSTLPRYHVHVHGGAWRDPQLTSRSIEPTVAQAFSDVEESAPIAAVASINYSLSQFPTHPTLPYDALKDNHTDPSREAMHPQHLSDVLRGLALLRSFGLSDRSYVLSGHSAGALLAFGAILASPAHYGLGHLPEAPCPAALLGLNGLYDLPALVDGLGDSHEQLSDDYEILLSYAFGADRNVWPAASPALLDPNGIAERVKKGRAPRLVVLDQSTDDQLVPMNQKSRLEANLSQVSGLRLAEGHRCTGLHAAPWEYGTAIWESLQDVLALLQSE